MKSKTITESKDIQNAIKWVRSWYDKRYQQKDTKGMPYLTDTEYALIQNRLDDIEVIVSKYPLLTLYQEVIEGRLHLRKSLPDGYALTETETKALMDFSKDMIGMYSPLLREPAIFLNPEELLNSNLHWTQNEGNTIHGSLAKSVVHEATHAATSGFLNIDQTISNITGQNNNGQSVDYYDLPVEIYARISELRFMINADPSHVFTIDEIKELRKKAEKDQKLYSKEIKAIGKKNISDLQQLPLNGKILDHQIFTRYTDEQIMHLLNDTACRMSKDLDEEHQWNLPEPEVSLVTYKPTKFANHRQINECKTQMRFKV